MAAGEASRFAGVATWSRTPRQRELARAGAAAMAAGERTFVVLAFFLFTGGVLNLARNPGRFATDLVNGDPVIQTVYAVVYVMTALLALRNVRGLLRAAAGGGLVLPLVGLALASTLWSYAPDVTLRRSVALLGTTLLGIYVAARFPMREQIHLLAVALATAAVLSALSIAALPGYGISSEFLEGTWRGIYVHKNSLGQYMALGAVVLVLEGLSARRHRLSAWGFAALCVVLLLGSRSATALVVFAAAMVLLPFCLLLRKRSLLAAAALSGAVVLAALGAVLLLEYWTDLLMLLGKDASLTGRTDIWSAVMRVLPRRFWLGWGLGGFWLGWSSDAALVWDAVGWTPPHAHNGILDLWLELGLTGVVVFVAGFLWVFRRAIDWLRRTGGGTALWPVLFVACFALYNMPSRILEANGLWWALYVATTLSMGKARRTASNVGRA